MGSRPRTDSGCLAEGATRFHRYRFGFVARTRAGFYRILERTCFRQHIGRSDAARYLRSHRAGPGVVLVRAEAPLDRRVVESTATRIGDRCELPMAFGPVP